ncbi:invasion associated locus B family protein [Sedimenticola sp.]
MMMQRGCAKILLALVLLAPLTGWGAEETKSEGMGEQAAQVFGDWGRRCEALKTSGEELCLIFQRLRLKDKNQTILHVTFGYPPAGKGPVMVLTTPLGVALAAGVEMQVDSLGEPLKVPYNICVADGCRASLVVTDNLLESMRKGDKLKVAFANAQNKPVGLLVSLKGFVEADQSLQK